MRNIIVITLLFVNYTNFSQNNNFEQSEEEYLELLKESFILPESYFTLGKYYEAVNRYEDCEWMYSKILELEPNHTQAINRLIDFYVKTGELEKALEWQQKLLKKSSDDPEAHVKLGELAYLNGQPGKARVHFDMAIERAPSDIKIPLKISNFLRVHEEFVLAEKYLEKGLIINVSSYTAFQAKSLILHNKGLLKEALDNLDNGIAVEKTRVGRANLLLVKATLCYFSQNYVKAVIYSEEAEKEAVEFKGVSNLFQNLVGEDYQSAETTTAEFLKVFPRDPDFHYLNAITKTKLGKNEEALTSLEFAVKNQPIHIFQNSIELKSLQVLRGYQHLMRVAYPEKFDDLSTFNFKKEKGQYIFKNCLTLANFYERQKEEKRANALYEKAIELKPESISNEDALKLAEVYLKKGKIHKAKAISPNQIDSQKEKELIEAGKLFYLLGKKKSAKSHFDKVLNASKDVQVGHQIGTFYKNHGALEEAEAIYKASIRKDPNAMNIHRSLSRLYFFFDQKEKAFEVLTNAKKQVPNDFNSIALEAILRYFDDTATSKSYFDAASEGYPYFSEIWSFLDLVQKDEFDKADKMVEVLDREYKSFWFEMAKYKYVLMKIRQGEKQKAVELLEGMILKEWFVNYQLYKTDEGLDPLREMDGFKGLMKRYFPEKGG